jgi:hypothetical protein
VPSEEWEETVAKARGPLTAVGGREVRREVGGLEVGGLEVRGREVAR